MNEHHKSAYTDAMNGNKLWENANLFLLNLRHYSKKDYLVLQCLSNYLNVRHNQSIRYDMYASSDAILPQK